MGGTSWRRSGRIWEARGTGDERAADAGPFGALLSRRWLKSLAGYFSWACYAKIYSRLVEDRVTWWTNMPIQTLVLNLSLRPTHACEPRNCSCQSYFIDLDVFNLRL